MSITSPQFDEPTPCAGKWSLFDSRDLADHIEAATLCRECPVQLACANVLISVQRAPSHLGGTPEGTWAGQLMGGKPARVPGRCGTETGHARHVEKEETPCKACKLARHAGNRRRAKARAEKKAA